GAARRSSTDLVDGTTATTVPVASMSRALASPVPVGRDGRAERSAPVGSVVAHRCGPGGGAGTGFVRATVTTPTVGSTPLAAAAVSRTSASQAHPATSRTTAGAVSRSRSGEPVGSITVTSGSAPGASPAVGPVLSDGGRGCGSRVWPGQAIANRLTIV